MSNCLKCDHPMHPFDASFNELCYKCSRIGGAQVRHLYQSHPRVHVANPVRTALLSAGMDRSRNRPPRAVLDPMDRMIRAVGVLDLNHRRKRTPTRRQRYRVDPRSRE